MKRLSIIGTIALLSLTLVWPALATTASGRQNPDLTVSVSLTSNGADPDVATVGDIVTVRLSVTNNTWRFEENVNMRVVVTLPDGRPFEGAVTLPLAPFQTVAPRVTFPVSNEMPAGRYAVTLEANNGDGVSSATATLTII
jgi:uncharacterized protein (DUF58 family)